MNATEKAKLFSKEIDGFIDTLPELAVNYGVETLADIFYLQTAILNDSFLDFDPESTSKLFEVVKKLDSCEEWLKHIKTYPMIEDVRVPVKIKNSSVEYNGISFN